MLKSHTGHIDTTAKKQARKKYEKNNLEGTKQKCRLGTASDKITGGGGGCLAKNSAVRSTDRPDM